MKRSTGVKRGDDDGSFVCTFVPPGFGVKGIEITGIIPGLSNPIPATLYTFRCAPSYPSNCPWNAGIAAVLNSFFDMRVASLVSDDPQLITAFTELSDYPTSHQTILYASSDDPPIAATSALNKISLENTCMPLPVLLSTISSSLTKAMDTAAQSSFISSPDSCDEEMGDSAEEYDDDSDVSVGGWEEPLEYYPESGAVDGEGDSQMDDFSQDPQHTANTRKLLHDVLRKDLRGAKAAGFKVGVLGDWKGGMDLYVCIGIRVSKLGISDEAIAAWKLDRRKYLILLIHYSANYQPLERLTGESGGYHVKKSVEMCVGTATRYKPTHHEAMGAFSKISSMGKTQQVVGVESGELEASAAPVDESNEDGFQGIFISRPLNELLNSRLIQLVKYRVQLGFGWDGAESYYAGK